MAQARITIGTDDTGGPDTGAYRFTMQIHSRNGRKLTFGLEGDIGRSDDGTLARCFRGWRPRLYLKWSFALSTVVERYNGTAWVFQGLMATSQAVWMIHSACNSAIWQNNAVWVEPFGESSEFPGFLARPSSGVAWNGGVGQLVNRDLELELEGILLTQALPEVELPTVYGWSNYGWSRYGW